MRLPLILALAVLGPVLPCRSTEVGLGVSMRNDGSTLYVPVTVSPSWMLEGRCSFYHSHSETTFDTQKASSTGTGESLDLGIFWTRNLSEKTRLYLGPRIGFGHSEWRTTQQGNPDTTTSKGDEFILAPVIGIEYFPVKSVSLGGEVGVNYGRSHSSSTYAPQATQSMAEDATGTFSALILRYHF